MIRTYNGVLVALSSPMAAVTAFATALSAMFLSGCLSVPTPERFVVTRGGSNQVQMVSADDALFWVREFEDEYDDGDLEFWSATLRKDFEDNRGYVIIEEKDFTDKKGRPGKELLAEVTVDGVPQRYLCLLSLRSSLTQRVIRVAEYTAPKLTFEAHLSAVRDAALAATP